VRHFLDTKDGNSLSTTQYTEDEETKAEKTQMTEVIKHLNKEELPWYVLTNIKQKIVNEQLRKNMEDLSAVEG
jgi:hypothetical protein